MDDQQRNRNRGTSNDCNSSTFNLVMGQSNLYGNMKPHDVDISHTQNVLVCKLSMTVSGQKSKNAFAMVLNVDNSVKLLTLKLTLSSAYALKASPCKSGYAFNYRKEKPWISIVTLFKIKTNLMIFIKSLVKTQSF